MPVASVHLRPEDEKRWTIQPGVSGIPVENHVPGLLTPGTPERMAVAAFLLDKDPQMRRGGPYGLRSATKQEPLGHPGRFRSDDVEVVEAVQSLKKVGGSSAA
jgi:hypothetical protein